MHELGYRGQGTKIAIIDCGFFRANKASVFPQDQIAGVFDLIPEDVRQHEIFNDPNDNHGTCCLSTMLREDDEFCGTAPDAEYYLFRTEDFYHENLAEGQRLIRALWMADSLDVDVITISLGYFDMDDPSQSYTYADMDGMGELAQAATAVAQRGRIICVAAGNEGNSAWHYISTPADAQDVVTVGAVDEQGKAVAFSSWGPTSDGRQKPEISAWGQQTWVYKSWRNELGNYTGGMVRGNGTSFATPEVAGMFACLRQALPTKSAEEIRMAVYETASQYTTPDMHIGYGVPDAYAAYEKLMAGTGWQDIPHSNGAQKILRGEQIIIVRGGIEYDLTGKRL